MFCLSFQIFLRLQNLDVKFYRLLKLLTISLD